MADRPYLFYELTNSVCSQCLRKVEAKVVFEDGQVFMLKHCPVHRAEKVLVCSDEAWYRLARNYLKPGQLPLKFNTPIRYGCPYDCGLCPDHEQHSCLTLLEITDHCNLACPVCYADSGPARQTHRSFEQVAFMLDRIVKNEGKPDIVQVSGGEPTVHPQFFEILDLAKTKPIRHLMVNTNGVRLAQEPEFAKRLASYKPGFEVYLQFDSLDAGALKTLRGGDLTSIRRRALEALNEHDVSTTLVVTLQKGVNDHEIGRIIDFALSQPCVRGVTFQPVQHAGRVTPFDAAKDRLTLSEVRQQILRQHALFRPEDVIPVPCHPDGIAMAYALKTATGAVPLTGFFPKEALLQAEGSTIVYESQEIVRKKIYELFSTAHSPESATTTLGELLCCLPKIETPSELTYRNVFRVIIMKFMDAHDFDVRSVKKSCVHIAHPDGRIIPFDTYNLFYRDGLEAKLAELQALHDPEPRLTRLRA